MALEYYLGMNRISISCGGGGEEVGSTRKRLVLRRDKVFGQKVGAEISCSGLSGTQGRAVKSESLDCQADILL